VSATTSATTQAHLFNNILYKPFAHMASQALYSTGVPMSDNYKDYVNDIIIHLYLNVLPRITTQKATTFLKYGYTSCRNYIITNIINKNSKMVIEYNNNPIEIEGSLYSDDMVKQYDVKVQIVERLDEMISKQRIMNKTNTIFLLLLRQYLIDNNFNPTGFRTYVMRIMNIKRATFIGICSRLRITTKIFKDEELIS
jgi:hypothetical protein